MQRRIALVATALVLALVGVVAVRSYVGKADARAVAGLNPVQAYVAAAAIPSGTALADAVAKGLARQESLPRKTVPAGAVIEVTPSLGDLVAIGTLPAGSVLMQASFGPQQLHNEGGLPIPKGEMAVTISLGDPERVGGFVQPGSEIAIFDTYNTIPEIGTDGRAGTGNQNTAAGDGLAMGTMKKHVTRLLLERVSVIAIGSTVARVASAEAPAAADASSKDSAQSSSSSSVLVTVALRQRDAEKLILASQTGKLYLGLLTKDSSVAAGPGADNTNLFK